jgi:hypothetical protein
MLTESLSHSARGAAIGLQVSIPTLFSISKVYFSCDIRIPSTASFI